jgi:hypothetical protein
MKRDRSDLSRDELCLLLSVCVQHAQDEVARLKERLAAFEQAAEGTVSRCAEPGCDAVSVRNVRTVAFYQFDCQVMYSCAWRGLCGNYFCDMHATGNLSNRKGRPCKRHDEYVGGAEPTLCHPCVLKMRTQYGCTCNWGPFVSPKEGLK